MTFKEVMSELKALGTAQNRKVYARHGVTGDQYGVSFANLAKLQRKIKKDPELARKLWASRNHDAMILATKIADPSVMKASELDQWAKDVGNHVQSALLSTLAKDAPTAPKRMEKWTRSRNEWISSAGYNLLSSLAKEGNDLSNDYFQSYIDRIESTIHSSKNRVRYSMNTALISIGVRNAKLKKLAVRAAKKIGKVEVDHGDTSCKTPDAVSYIEKTLAHRRKKKSA